MRIVLPLVLLCLVSSMARAATVWPGAERFVWDFTLQAVTTTTSLSDDFTIQLDASDRLVFPDMMRILLYAGDLETPLFAQDWRGTASGLNGLWVLRQDWHLAFAGGTGRLELEMLTGTVALRRVTIAIQDGSKRSVASISPQLILIPEPGSAFCLTAAAGLWLMRRRRQAGSFSCRPSSRQ